jgi:ferredoxin
MCEYCEKFGSDDIWYLNRKGYARQLYRRKLPGEKFVPEAISYRQERSRLRDLWADARLKKDQEKTKKLSQDLDRLYQENEPCQVLPLKDCYKILEYSNPIASMSCICRKQTRATDERHPDEYSCLGLGTGMLKWERWPERYRGGVQFLSTQQAKEWFDKWDKAGMVHMIMVYGTENEGLPFVGGLCNCDYPDCIPLRIRHDYDIKHVLLKAHYVAVPDYDLCTGCGTCVERCQFGAIKMEVTTGKTNIDMFKCFGCGVCETGCPTEAITLERREKFPALREEW